MVLVERQWAVGMSQIEFEREWQKKNPFADVIPDVNEWLNHQHPQSRLIEPFNFESMDLTGEGKVAEKPKVEEKPTPTEVKSNRDKLVERLSKKTFHCRGCNREFNYKVAWVGHEKYCKSLMNVKV